MKKNAKYLCLMGIFLAISANVANGETYEIDLDEQDTDLYKLGSNILFGMNNGNISVHYNLSETNYEYDAFKFNSTEAIVAMAEGKNQIFVAKEDDGIYWCPFDFKNPSAYRCTDKAKKLQVNSTKVSGMAVMGTVLYFVGHDGSLGYCNFTNGACNETKETNEDYTGISYNSTLNETYVSSNDGYLYRSPAARGQTKFNLTNVFEQRPWFFKGFQAVHIAFGSVWVGSRHGELFKCPLAERKDKLNCDEFIKFEWSKLPPSEPTIHSISSKDGKLYAHVHGAGSNRILQCNDPNEPKSCKAFKSPAATEAFLLV